MERINNNWLFTPDYDNGFDNTILVRLPHSPKEIPLHYADPSLYEMVSGYKKTITFSNEDLKKRLFLQFDGSAHTLTLFFNGKEVGTHSSGYTAYRVEITSFVHLGDNEIVIKLDSRESQNIPPFGNVIDYLTYSGLYRDVWLDKRNKTFISDIKQTKVTLTSLNIGITIDGKLSPSSFIEWSLNDLNGKEIAKGKTKSNKIEKNNLSLSPWSPDSPNLYTLNTRLFDEGKVIDEVETTLGFRTIEIRGKHLLLNGKKIFLRGLNRHQSWPYIGYAGSERLQREDARILKYKWLNPEFCVI